MIHEEAAYAVELARLERLVEQARVEGKEIVVVVTVHLQMPSLLMLLRNPTD